MSPKSEDDQQDNLILDSAIMAERKKQTSRGEGNKKASRRLSGNSMMHIVQSEKGKLKIGNYILGTTLGHGTFGKVKREEMHDIYICCFILYNLILMLFYIVCVVYVFFEAINIVSVCANMSVFMKYFFSIISQCFACAGCTVIVYRTSY
jgi:hypothetical protein